MFFDSESAKKEIILFEIGRNHRHFIDVSLRAVDHDMSLDFKTTFGRKIQRIQQRCLTRTTIK